GIERTFRRAESASFFGREIGLMYVHAHLRYAEAMAVLGEADALWDALGVVNPISVTECVPNASPRQRNAYFSSSDAAFSDRYEAKALWSRVGAVAISFEGGWRIYSSGPGLYINVLLRHALGVRRRFGDRVKKPVLPDSLGALTLVSDLWTDAGFALHLVKPVAIARIEELLTLGRRRDAERRPQSI